MKSLKLDHELAEMVVRGQKTTTWRLFDDKDLSVDDRLLLIDKVDPHQRSTWTVIGTAIVTATKETRLGELDDTDKAGHEKFDSPDQLLATYQRYYGEEVTWKTPVKVVHFTFISKAGQSDMAASKVIIYADGGSRGNPGPSAAGFVLYDEAGSVLLRRGIYLGITTNNLAEYTALKLALEEVKSMGARDIEVYMDSMLVINQMKGIFKVKNRDLWPIHNAVKELCNQFKQVRFTQVPREINKLADAVVNEVLDNHSAKS